MANIASRCGKLLHPSVWCGVLLLVFVLGTATLSRAVLFYSTADPSYNTNAPTTRSLTNSGWQYVGQWGVYPGTAIATNYFITAQHVGGNVGDPFLFHGTNYTTTAAYDDPETDLRLWRVDGILEPHAPLYTRHNERNHGLVVIGRGTQRGAEVRVNGVLKGWQWGYPDGVQRWGRNIVSSIHNGGPGQGDLLQVKFNAHGVPSEAHLSSGDSGGPVFIKDGRYWKLAGVNYSVDGLFNTNSSGSGFSAALFDVRGLYVQQPTGWLLAPDWPARLPSSFYATRISSRTNWINSILLQAQSAE